MTYPELRMRLDRDDLELPVIVLEVRADPRWVELMRAPLPNPKAPLSDWQHSLSPMAVEMRLHAALGQGRRR